MTKKLQQTYAKFQKRDNLGRFVKEIEDEKVHKIERVISYLSTESLAQNQDDITRLLRKKREIREIAEPDEPETEYEYFIGVNYKSPRGHAHDFNCEFIVTSDTKLSVDGLAERIKDGTDAVDSNITTVVNNSTFILRNTETSVKDVPQNQIKIGRVRN